MNTLFIGGTADGELRDIPANQPFVNCVVENDDLVEEYSNESEKDASDQYHKYDRRSLEIKLGNDSTRLFEFFLWHDMDYVEAIERLFHYYHPVTTVKSEHDEMAEYRKGILHSLKDIMERANEINGDWIPYYGKMPANTDLYDTEIWGWKLLEPVVENFISEMHNYLEKDKASKLEHEIRSLPLEDL